MVVQQVLSPQPLDVCRRVPLPLHQVACDTANLPTVEQQLHLMLALLPWACPASETCLSLTSVMQTMDFEDSLNKLVSMFPTCQLELEVHCKLQLK
jgi:hypothetical protein